MIEEVLFTFLESNLAANIFYAEADQDAETPFIVYELTSRDKDHPKNSVGLTYSEIQIDCYDAKPVLAGTLGNQVRTLLDDFKGDMLGTHVTLARITNEYDSEEQQSGSFIRTLNLSINNT